MSRISTAAVQFKWSLDDYKDRESFRKRIFSVMESIKSRVDKSLPLLVVFPEDIGTPMLIFGSYDIIKDKSSFAEAVRCMVAANLARAVVYRLRYGVSFVRALLLLKGADMERDYVDIFSWAAKEYNAYIAAGSITLPDTVSINGRMKLSGKDVYNKSYFFGPDGIIGTQKKVHLVDFEGKSGFDLSCGKLEDINTFDTHFGKIGIAICLDGFKEDVCQRLMSQGADVLLQPSANNIEWTDQEQQDWLKGSYTAAHTNKMFKYAINPMMNGSILDLSFEGQSSIVYRSTTGLRSNYNLLEPVDGFVRIAKHHNAEEILIGELEV